MARKKPALTPADLEQHRDYLLATCPVIGQKDPAVWRGTFLRPSRGGRTLQFLSSAGYEVTVHSKAITKIEEAP